MDAIKTHGRQAVRERGLHLHLYAVFSAESHHLRRCPINNQNTGKKSQRPKRTKKRALNAPELRVNTIILPKEVRQNSQVGYFRAHIAMFSQVRQNLILPFWKTSFHLLYLGKTTHQQDSITGSSIFRFAVRKLMPASVTGMFDKFRFKGRRHQSPRKRPGQSPGSECKGNASACRP